MAATPWGVFWDGRRRFHPVFFIAGALFGAAGLLGYAVALPEIPFAQAPTGQVSSARPGDTVKLYGALQCSCEKAIDRTDVPAAWGPRDWNATFDSFSLRDPSGSIYIDTDSLTRLRPGPHDGDYLNGDAAAVYGTVYDQGLGVLALRAQMIAKDPADTFAKDWPLTLVVAGVGAVLLAAVFTDRLVFGRADG